MVDLDKLMNDTLFSAGIHDGFLTHEPYTTRLQKLTSALAGVRRATEGLQIALDELDGIHLRHLLPSIAEELERSEHCLLTTVEYERLKDKPEIWTRVPCLQLSLLEGRSFNGEKIVFGKPLQIGLRWALVARTWPSNQPAKHAIVYRKTGAQCVLDSKATIKRLSAFVKELEAAESLEAAHNILRQWRRS